MDAVASVATLNTDTKCRELGERVRHIRKTQVITQEELGFRSDLSNNHIGCLERGEKNVSAATLFKVAYGLRVEAWELFKGIKNL